MDKHMVSQSARNDKKARMESICWYVIPLEICIHDHVWKSVERYYKLHGLWVDSLMLRLQSRVLQLALTQSLRLLNPVFLQSRCYPIKCDKTN